MFPSMPNRPDVAARAVAFSSEAKNERFIHEYRRLATRARDFALAHPRLAGLGEDPLVEHLLCAAGFDEVDVVAMRVATKGRMVTALCIPRRLWRDPFAMSRLIKLKREAGGVGTRCILVPQGWLKAETRAGVARSLAHARRGTYTRGNSDQVLAYLREVRISTVVETANAVVGHPDPVSVVLSMASQGLIGIDRSALLRGDTWVSTIL